MNDLLTRYDELRKTRGAAFARAVKDAAQVKAEMAVMIDNKVPEGSIRQFMQAQAVSLAVYCLLNDLDTEAVQLEADELYAHALRIVRNETC